jgi:hypothetical protein
VSGIAAISRTLREGRRGLQRVTKGVSGPLLRYSSSPVLGIVAISRTAATTRPWRKASPGQRPTARRPHAASSGTWRQGRGLTARRNAVSLCAVIVRDHIIVLNLVWRAARRDETRAYCTAEGRPHGTCSAMRASPTSAGPKRAAPATCCPSGSVSSPGSGSASASAKDAARTRCASACAQFSARSWRRRAPQSLIQVSTQPSV